jgi:peptidoglycan/xylan/chitin deacetylase (PgdA/CDA1 family)
LAKFLRIKLTLLLQLILTEELSLTKKLLQIIREFQSMMIKKIGLVGLLILIALSETAFAETPRIIRDYHQIFIPGYDKKNNLEIAIRMYYVGITPYFLVVNPYTFTTESLPAIDFKSRKVVGQKNEGGQGNFTMRELKNTPYMRALERYSTPLLPPLQNAGITRAEHKVDGVFLTIDMCPSNKPFEKAFFKKLVERADKLHDPVPITLAMSGLWIIDHSKEFSWLIQQEKANKLQITWMNHSFSHVYYPDLPAEKNFLLSAQQAEFGDEILDTEKLLLEYNQLPSVFFRFPGLVSDRRHIKILRKFGLIPVGANAWLAKGQPAQEGSIILVHGNSNEHTGIEMIISLLDQNKFRLLPLSQAFQNIEDFQGSRDLGSKPTSYFSLVKLKSWRESVMIR